MSIKGSIATGASVTRSESTRRALLEALEVPFVPPIWLRGAHAQTIWSPLMRPKPKLRFQVALLRTADGDDLRIHQLEGESGTPHVLFLHGLEGSAQSNYILGPADRFLGLGWGVKVLEFRSCGGAPHRAPRLYHSGETSDLDFVVKTLVRKEPGRRLYLSGASLGGNVLAKWLGEQADRLPDEVRGAAVISPPFDLTISGPATDRALGGLYVRRFLRTLVPKAIEKERQYPGSLDIARVRDCSTFLEFDTHATAALHGFEDAWDYWERCGCGQFLPAVSRPLLLIAARDDPFNPARGLPEARTLANPALFPCFSDRGGHVGFVHGKPWRTRHWAEERVEAFFRALEAS